MKVIPYTIMFKYIALGETFPVNVQPLFNKSNKSGDTTFAFGRRAFARTKRDYGIICQEQTRYAADAVEE